MELIVDPDVRTVAEFMQQAIPPSRLVAVAKGVANLAPLLWGDRKAEEVIVIRLQPEPITPYAARTQSTASE
jgi:hypothetical protein